MVKADFNYISFNNAYADDTYLWASSNTFNGLLRINTVNWEADFITTFKNASPAQDNIHKTVVEHNGILYFCPNYGDGLDSYELSSGRQEHYNIIGAEGEFFRTGDVTVFNSQLFVFPTKIANLPFYIFDLERKTALPCDIIKEKMKDLRIDGRAATCTSIAIVSDTVWLPLMETQYIIELHLDNQNIVLHEVCGYRFHKIAYDGERFWLSMSDSRKIIEWHPDLGVISTYYPENGEMECEKSPYIQLIPIHDKLLVIPLLAQKILMADKSSNRLIEIGDYPENFILPMKSRMKWPMYFFGYDITDNKNIRLYPRAGNMMLMINTDTLEISAKPILLSREGCRKYYEVFLYQKMLSSIKNGVVNERANEEFSLDSFLNVITLKDKWEIDNDMNIENSNGTCGEEIWKYVKNELE